MRIAVTGAAGFLGRMLVEDLATRDALHLDGESRRISAILATDVIEPPLSDLSARYRRVHALPGAISDSDVLNRLVEDSPDLIIHLAAVVSGQAEAEFDLGMQVNLQGTLDLITACRAMRRPPVVIFASSVAVFSAPGNGTITDQTLPAPLSSYGAQKLAGEILIRDASRRGMIRGRSLLFPTVSVRPGAPNKAASSFASGILREPMAGMEAILPVGRGVRLHLASPDRALDYTLHAAALPQDALTGDTTLTLPGLSVSVDEMITTLREIAGPETAARIVERPDPGIDAIVSSWPGRILTPRAEGLGFTPNATIAEIITEHRARMAAQG